MKRKLWRLAAISYRQARKIVVFIIGGTIVLVGVALIVLPGPAFIVFTSNVFAICGLRSLYFALAGMMDRFRYLKPSLVFLLAYIGVKMIWNGVYHEVEEKKIDDILSLSIVGCILVVGIVASLAADWHQDRKNGRANPNQSASDREPPA